ncbi:LOW QUALITY PROTEIN: hypothetical protein YC2023_118671 [Brassica napus]
MDKTIEICKISLTPNITTIHPLTALDNSCRLIRIISTDAFHQKPSSHLRKQPSQPPPDSSSIKEDPHHQARGMKDDLKSQELTQNTDSLCSLPVLYLIRYNMPIYYQYPCSIPSIQYHCLSVSQSRSDRVRIRRSRIRWSRSAPDRPAASN